MKKYEGYQQQLLDVESSLRVYALHLQTVREEERTCISRELHDHLGQLLIALRIHMFRLAKKTSNIALPHLKEINNETQQIIIEIDNVIQSVRYISRGLRPTDLDNLGLLSAIEIHVKNFQTRTNIDCQYYSNVETIIMDKDHEIGVYRIVQESLTNIVRHANATKILISVTKEREFYLITVTDNGIGFTDNQLKRNKTLGLLSMHERTALFGGKLSISGSLGKGTMIALQIPIIQP